MRRFFGERRIPSLGLALTSLAVVACASIPPGSVAGASGSSKPHRGGTLTMAVGTTPASMNHDVTDNPTASNIQRMIENQLFNKNAKQELVPSLATGYKESKDGLTYTISLRHGIKWSDGTPFTSKDVVFTLEKFLPITPHVPQTLLTALTTIKSDGRYTVVIQLKQPYSPLMLMLGGTFYILPQHLYGNQTVVKDNQANDHPVGTGPFILKKWIPNQKVVLVRNPNYWGATKKHPYPYFNSIVIDVITNPQTIVDDLLSGAVDYVPTTFLPTTSIKEIQHSSCCRAVAIHGEPGYDVMYTNTARAPFNNPVVRKAVYMAMTRKLILQDALSGFGSLPNAIIPSSFPSLYTPKINLTKQYPYDPAKAAKMLDQAGFPATNGERFGKAITLLYSSSTGELFVETGAIIKSELAKITINVNLIGEDLTSWATQTYVKKDFTLSIVGLTSRGDPSLGITRAFACQPTPTSEFTNASGYCTKTVTALFKQAVAAPTTAGRQRAYAKAQKLLDAALPSYMMYWRTTYVALSKRIQNWKVSLRWGGAFTTTWSQSWF